MRAWLVSVVLLAACGQKPTDTLTEPLTESDDADGDGFDASNGDCDDDDATISPDAIEVCDGIDNNCDGVVDEGVSTTWYADSDGDAFGDAEDTVSDCQAPSGYVSDDSDCDDADGAINPSADEICDGLDNDCDGLIDTDDDSLDPDLLGQWFTDADGDGYGDEDTGALLCEQPDGAVDRGGDCDDSDIAFNPGATEDDCTDSNDYNCDGSVGYADNDGDGFAACEECNDANSDINPDAIEICDSIDNDCDALTDDEDEVDPSTQSTFYADSDSDGFGDKENTTDACDAPSGYVSDTSDCDDSNGAINPDAEEVCDEADNDCDGTTDVNATDEPTWYADVDSDGYGDSTDSTDACDQPSGYVSDDTDCDDSESEANPGESEVCDEIDNDCDKSVDEGVTTTFYVDSDGDGFGTSSSTDACEQPSGYTDNSNDCDDSDGAINPDAEEVCDKLDNDCDGTTDVGATDADTWYPDDDGDGYGDEDSPTASCDEPSGYLEDGSDCDDGDNEIYPGASEFCDGIDSDCDGDSTDDGLASFESSSGTWTDLTTTLGGGTSSAPTAWTLSSDGTLWLCDGTWYNELTVSASDASIMGLNGSATTIVSGGGSERVVYAGSTTLDIEGVTLTEGEATYSAGAGIYAYGTTLSLTDVVVSDCVSGYGGIYVYYGTLTADDVELTDNTSYTYGGGLLLSSSTASLSEVEVTGNSASSNGGGVYAYASTVTLADVLLDDNSSSSRGGGLYLTSSTATASDLVATNNTASDDGGGIAMRSSSTVSISDCTIDDNSSNSDGGGVHVHDSTLSLETCSVSDNFANKKGGGLHVDDDSVTLDDVTISDNEADNGGGIHVKNCVVSMTDTTIEDNTATKDDGGGVTIDKKGGLSVTTSDWSGNSPDDVYAKESGNTYSYGTSETFTCDDETCY